VWSLENLAITSRQKWPRRLVLMSTIIPIHIDRPFPGIEDDDVYEDEDED
jgi:hypothetical protein